MQDARKDKPELIAPLQDQTLPKASGNFRVRAEDSKNNRLLVVDDDPFICKLIGAAFHNKRYEIQFSHSLADALSAVSEFKPDVVLLDVVLPDGNGLDVTPAIRSAEGSPDVIIVTGYGEVDAAELAVRRGAWSYIVKGEELVQVVEAVEDALSYRKEKRSTLPHEVLRIDGIVGSSAALRDCMDMVSKASLTDANVLLVGETGTGKELFARAIHNNSRRRQKSFVVVDCASLPETLVESVLFGYAKGAFTGADAHREGLVIQAHGGTLFLDEVGEMPPALQKTFLRFLQERRFRPVGGDSEIESDFRLVAATNRSLDDLVEQGCFREDLLYRLGGFTLNLPPLRERLLDIQELVLYHMKRICEHYGLPSKKVGAEFVEFLCQYPWPGNVRQLVQTLESALIAAQDNETLFPQHLPDEVRVHVMRRVTAKKLSTKERLVPDAGNTGMTLKQIREAAADTAESNYLRELLARAGGNVRQACSLSGLSISRFYALLRKHRLLPLP